MAAVISVSVRGALLGLDDPERIRSELEAGTGLEWRREEVDHGRVLTGGIVEILLVAAVSKLTEESLGAALNATKRAVERWRAGRLDPPQAEVEVRSAPPSSADAPTGLPDEGGPRGSEGVNG
ncbi:hypothetical protein AB5J52_27400 [Streptomyces sp. R39]|uniref:Uncharacterized protein n=1 Tax=Streptomyces sp. R39 TaxID=3238631 RepID=A0AB39QTL1_9ACTN